MLAKGQWLPYLVTTFRSSEIIFVQLLRQGTTRGQEAIPLGMIPLHINHLMQGIHPYWILSIVKVTYTWWWGKKPSKDIEVYNIESGSILSSLHQSAFFVWHIGLLLLLPDAHEAMCEWALRSSLTGKVAFMCAPVYTVQWISFCLRSCTLLYYSVRHILKGTSTGSKDIYILNTDILLTSTVLTNRKQKIRSLLNKVWQIHLIVERQFICIYSM